MVLPGNVAQTLDRLENAGWESYAVGGCVRDALLGIEPHDWDLCTAAPPEEMKKVFAGERILETGIKHGTLTLLTPSGPLEITTFRAESAYTDRRHPDSVSFLSDVHADLARRDFTVNAMAYSPKRGLRDDFHGREDLQNGVLRCVGEPGERFREDALRLLRALRFAARFRLTIEEKTAAALRENRELLRQSVAGLENTLEGYDTQELTNFYQSLMAGDSLAQSWMAWKYDLLQERVDHLAQTGAALDVYVGPITHDSHQYLYNTLFLVLLTESVLLGLLCALYLVGYEGLSGTQSLTCASRTGRGLWKIR